VGENPAIPFEGRLDSLAAGAFSRRDVNKLRQADKQWHPFAARPSGVHQQEHSMPKMKTKKSAAKRFRVRPGGTVKRGQAFKRHILTKKTTKNKRHLRGAVNVHETNMGHMAQMLPFAGL
jgi:large subunit ribosomal protein L35